MSFTYIYLSTYLSIFLSVYLSIYLSIFLSVSLFRLFVIWSEGCHAQSGNVISSVRNPNVWSKESQEVSPGCSSGHFQSSHAPKTSATVTASCPAQTEVITSCIRSTSRDRRRNLAALPAAPGTSLNRCGHSWQASCKYSDLNLLVLFLVLVLTPGLCKKEKRFTACVVK